MRVTISLDGVKLIDDSRKSYYRRQKGNSLLSFPNDFTVVDLETTGLDSTFDEIIEVGAIKVRNGNVTDTFNSLVKPEEEIDEFITEITGITNEMVADAPSISKVLPNFLSFVGDDIIVGHNVSFDINFLYDTYLKLSDRYFSNSYSDTLRLSKRLLPELKHHRLKDLIKYFNINAERQHRSLDDCKSTLECYNKLKSLAVEKYDTLDNFYIENKSKRKKRLDLSQIKTAVTEFDEDNPFFEKVCVFTGVLEKMKRSDAAQLVVDLGGICGNSVTKKTNYLILGNNDYCPTIRDGKSTKQKKAEELKLKGNDIEIISENTFYDMLNM